MGKIIEAQNQLFPVENFKKNFFQKIDTLLGFDIFWKFFRKMSGWLILNVPRLPIFRHKPFERVKKIQLGGYQGKFGSRVKSGFTVGATVKKPELHTHKLTIIYG